MSNVSVPRPEYPRPQFVREKWLNLNGIWEFEIDPGRSGIQRGLMNTDKLSQKIIVPFCPESELSGIGVKDFMAAVWYRKVVNLPEEWAGSRVLLHFGAVDYDTRVWVNGKEAGSHFGGYTPFTFEITELLQSGENIITVYAEDDTRSSLQASGKQCPDFYSRGCHYTRTTGIWQTVWVEAVPAAYIADVKLKPDLEGGKLLVYAKVNGGTKDITFKAAAAMGDAPVGSAEAQCYGGQATVELEVSEVRAWSPEDPFLYDLKLSLEGGNSVIDQTDSYFGLRSIKIDAPVVLLNGKPVFQRLVLDQGFYPDGIYTAPTDEALKNDIKISMGLGFNGARLHEKVFEPRFLYWADKLGYLVWGEYPNWGVNHSSPETLRRYLSEWMEALERDYNHPSIVGWCPFNETPRNQDPELLRRIYRVTKAFDHTRPVIDTSGYVHVETDLYDVHDYDQKPETFAERYRPLAEGGEARRNAPDHDAPYMGQPYWVSEYGGIWWNPGQLDSEGWGYGGVDGRPKSEEEFLDRYRKLTETLLNHPRMCAFCYTQLYDIEQEVNGLYYYNRQAKFDPEKIKAINSQKAAIEKD
ncbi:glycoside hydrolase family 2 protein [Candidatus Poribacteria bacterium]